METFSRDVDIDVLKAVAIVAVFVDHTNGLLYTNPTVAWTSYFSVTLFVFLSGVTQYESNIRHMDRPWLSETLRKLKGIFIPYAIATGVYVVNGYKMLDLKIYLLALTQFTASAPFYFVLFYLQLMIISRPLTQMILQAGLVKYKALLHLVYGILILFFSAVCIRYTYILPVHGGGQYLFGGTFLFVYYIGMIFARMRRNVKWNFVKSIFMLILGLLCIIYWIRFLVVNGLVIDEKFKYFGGLNPPGPSLWLYSAFVVIVGLNMGYIVRHTNISFINKIWDLLGNLGKHSLYIFLFHAFFIVQIPVSWVNAIFENKLIRGIGYMSIVFCSCIFTEKIIEVFCGRLRFLNIFNKMDLED